MSAILDTLSQSYYERTSLIRVALFNALGMTITLLQPRDVENLVGLLYTTPSVKKFVSQTPRTGESLEDWDAREIRMWDEVRRQVHTPELWLKLMSMRDA